MSILSSVLSEGSVTSIKQSICVVSDVSIFLSKWPFYSIWYPLCGLSALYGVTSLWYVFSVWFSICMVFCSVQCFISVVYLHSIEFYLRGVSALNRILFILYVMGILFNLVVIVFVKYFIFRECLISQGFYIFSLPIMPSVLYFSPSSLTICLFVLFVCYSYNSLFNIFPATSYILSLICLICIVFKSVV